MSKTLYFTHMPRSPQWMDLYQIWFRGSPRGHNQMCGILLQSAHGFRFCEGSKFIVENVIFGIADPDLPIHYATFMGLR